MPTPEPNCQTKAGLALATCWALITAAQLFLGSRFSTASSSLELFFLVSSLGLLAAGLLLTSAIIRRGFNQPIDSLTREMKGIYKRGELLELKPKALTAYLIEAINQFISDAQRGVEKSLMRERETWQKKEEADEILTDHYNQLRALKQVIDHSSEGIVEFDSRGNVVTANQAFAAIAGYSVLELKGKPWQTMIAFEDLDRVFAISEEAIEERAKRTLEAQSVGREGVKGFLEITLIPTFDHRGFLKGTHWFIRDISERRRLEAKVSYQAFNDELTGLPNRTQFTSELDLILDARPEPGTVAVLCFDLDNFKIINDSLGHAEGDQLLKTVAQRLRTMLPKTAGSARISGDEFVVYLSELHDPNYATELAQTVLRRLHEPMRLGDREVFVTCSIGIAVNTPETTTGNDLLKAADTAMYESKSRGKASFTLFQPSMNSDRFERLEIENGLRKAIDQNELRVAFQPIVCLNSGQILGAEALVRWEHPVHGLIGPNRFIPVAEETGLIVPLGTWVLRNALIQSQTLQSFTSGDFVVSVNVSTRQIHKPDFVNEILSAIEDAHASPSSVKIEITESAMMDDIDATISRLHELREAGIQIAVDDFGTGYSSLSYLRRLPIDTVKIDRSFVNLMGVDAEPTAIVHAIISLCHALSLNVTGEGIETLSQLQQLQELGCDQGQGYLLAKPMYINDFRSLMINADRIEAIVCEPHAEAA